MLYKGSMSSDAPEYFRRDREGGVTAPDLSKDCHWAAHVVRARGRRSRFTSVSLDKAKIEIFGPSLYLALRDKIEEEGHNIIEHNTLLEALRSQAHSTEKADRLQALQAIRYSTARKEGLIDWNFDTSRVERKDIITYGYKSVQQFFREI